MFRIPGQETLKLLNEHVNSRPRFWLTVFVLLLAIQISPCWYPKPDGSLYLSIARSMATGETVTGLGSPRLVVAPGYPALISPAFLFGDRPFLVISILQWFMAVACLFGIYHWGRRQFPSVAVMITGLAMLNAAVCLHYRRTLKEIAFMAIFIWAVNALHALDRQKSIPRMAAMALWAGLLIALASIVRYPGVVLVAGFGCSMLWKASHAKVSWSRAIGLTAAISAPALAAVLTHMWHEDSMAEQMGGGSTYVDGFTEALTGATAEAGGSLGLFRLQPRFLNGIQMQIRDMGRVTIPGMFKAYANQDDWLHVSMIVYLLWLAIIGVGWWQLAIRKQDVLALSLPFYLALYAIWSCEQGARFLVPMVPVLMACAWFGIARLFSNFSMSYRLNLLTILFVCHLGVAMTYWIAIDAPRMIEAHRQWPKVDILAAKIKSEPLPVAMIKDPRRTYLMLQLELDQVVTSYDVENPIGSNIHWLVVSTGTPVDSSFTLRQTVDDYQLFSRKPTDQPKPTTIVNRPTSKKIQ